MTSRVDALAQARMVADAVLYEGYLLYPYRASSEKNQMRWQFGILGPPGAEPGVGEPAEMRAQCLINAPADAQVTISLRFLQLQSRSVERFVPGVGAGAFESVNELRSGPARWVSWDEAVPHELTLAPLTVVAGAQTVPVSVAEGTAVEELPDGVGRLVRRRRELTADVHVAFLRTDEAAANGGNETLWRLSVAATNTAPAGDAGRDAALAFSFLGAHLLVSTSAGRFVSLLEPPDSAADVAGQCVNVRCWPVLAADDDDVLLISPIILYDHPQIAPESAGALFDATEIDEILTLRVMTMTDAEKAEARATDPHAAAIIDRCDAMTPESLQRLHGVLRDPHVDAALQGPDVGGLPADLPVTEPDGLTPWVDVDFPTWTDPPANASPLGGNPLSDSGELPGWASTDDAPWWDPAVDASVSPEHDSVVIAGTAVSKGSHVRVHPNRRADAQDIFFAGMRATVTAVYADVDGNDHVAVVLTDDPAADLHEWYGRFLYFAPDELEPLTEPVSTTERKDQP